MRAVVLAAGRGVRMGGRTPKCLERAGEREPLLHYLLRGIRRAGPSDLLVVTGFGADAVERYVIEQWSESPPKFSFNPRYASWGNFHSVRIALDQSPGMDVVVVNSDLVVHPDVLGRVLDPAGDLVLAVQRRGDLDPEDMRVELAGDRVRAIGKDLSPAAGHGEFCGVSLIRPRAARLYLDAATRAQWTGTTDVYYEDVYAAILEHVDARAVAVEAGEYAEVDEPADLERAAIVLDRHRAAWADPAHAAPARPSEQV